MSFASPVFLFCLPGVVLASWLLHRRVRLQNLFLLAFSLFFYGWWDWRFLGLLVATVLVDYAVGLRIAAARSPQARRAWLGLGLAFGLGTLGFFKYFDFFSGSLQALLSALGFKATLPVLDLILPMGLSFYTFRAFSYLIDVHRVRMAPVRSLLDYALYETFFPQLVAGPIERAHNLLPRLQAPKRPSPEQWHRGGYLLLYGLFQKVAVGDAAGSIADIALHHPYGGWVTVLTGTLAFTIQIYGDFAGYSNIARGCASLLGVDLMVNFRTPYFSASVTEFWHRWHISLSTFLRDYLYIPLGGNRLGEARSHLNLMVVMLLGGLWHGASWTFVVWGGLHGLYLAVHKRLLRSHPPAVSDARIGSLLKQVGTFALVSLTWLFFRDPTVADAWRHLRILATLQDGAWSPNTLIELGMIAAFLIPLDWLAHVRGTDTSPLGWPWWLRGPLYACFIASIYGGIGGRHPFLYYRF